MATEGRSVDEKRTWHTPELRKSDVRDNTEMEGDDGINGLPDDLFLTIISQ